MTRLHSSGRALRAGLALVVPLASAAMAPVGCGPSFQAVYEGDKHFEHCYAIDEKTVPDEVKKDCWREWLRGYTYGQSNDRVEYAATRFSQLSLDGTLPSEDVREPTPRRRKSERTLAAPVPTSAFAPPPNLSTVDPPDASAPPADAARPSAASPLVAAPGSDCVATCEARWSACRSSCKDGACDSCDRVYRTCMPTCFRDDAGAPKGK